MSDDSSPRAADGESERDVAIRPCAVRVFGVDLYVVTYRTRMRGQMTADGGAIAFVPVGPLVKEPAECWRRALYVVAYPFSRLEWHLYYRWRGDWPSA